jgi:glycosyltransferase involved in cell wall biosynthesis
VHFISHAPRVFAEQLFRCAFYRLFGSRIVKTCHNIRPHTSEKAMSFFLCEKIFSSFADHIIFFTEGQYQEFCQFYHLTPRRHSIIPHPYLDQYSPTTNREAARASLGIGPRDFVYFIFGGTLRYKNYDRVIAVFQNIRGPHDRLLAAIRPSTNPDEHEAFERCKRLLVEDRDQIIINSDFLDDDALQCYFGAADVIVLPFEDSTSSASFMLTLEFEIPFIAIANSFNRNVLNEKCGIYIRSIGELTDAMIRIKQEDLQPMRQEIVKRKPLFTWRRVVEQHIDMYRRIASLMK